MCAQRKTTLRIYPESWIDPCEFKHFFADPEKPLEVDMGSGKGRFLAARAGRFPDINYLGVERQLIRVNRSGRKCERAGRENVRLLRMEGYYTVRYLMPINYVSTYYFFFPDPWPKDRHQAHRLFDHNFRDALYQTLEPGGLLHIATDHLPYFDDIYQLLLADKRFCQRAPFMPEEEERTDFELIFSDKKIGRCSFEKRQ